MKPPPFAYAAPGSIPEALDILGQYADEGKLLAGGQSLVPLLNMRLSQPQVLVDLNRIDALRYMRAEDRDGRPGIAVGAMTLQRSTEDSSEVARRLPLLREAVSWVGHSQIRNRGTVGGSIAHADPAAELPLVFRALDGVATVEGGHGRRTVPAADFFQYTFTSALEPDEMLTEVWFPYAGPRTGQAFVEVARRHGDFALVAVAVSLTLGAAGTCEDVRIAIGGAAPVPARAAAAEESLRGHRELDAGRQARSEIFREVAAIAAREMEPTGDIHADAQYRRDVAETLTYRALMTAFERVAGGEA